MRAVELTRPGLTPTRKRELAQRDPSFLLELLDTETDALPFDDLPARVREDLGRASESSDGAHDTLANVVLNTHPSGSLRNELSLLRFALAFLEQWERQEFPVPRDHARAGQAESRRGPGGGSRGKPWDSGESGGRIGLPVWGARMVRSW